ncbi:MAG: GAF and ANTAR domain-containing protein [Actinomycetota bacterium]|nr:GAF and ANTAR domain-containing protein [Actinomycetota bacterium]
MPASSASLGKALDAMSQFFVGEATLHETLERVSQLACETVPATAMVGITMLVDGKARTAVFTDEAAPEIDSAQYETGVGPCLDAFRHQRPYRVEDTEQDGQWPPFSKAAASYGIRSSMSLPLLARHEAIGALNFYARSANAFSDDDVEAGQQFAAHAAIVLANSQAYSDAQQLGEYLAQAMKSRATIEQAKGILMAAQHCSPDEAFQILIRASQRENRKLRDLAEEVVVRTRSPKATRPAESSPTKTSVTD